MWLVEHLPEALHCLVAAIQNQSADRTQFCPLLTMFVYLSEERTHSPSVMDDV